MQFWSHRVTGADPGYRARGVESQKQLNSCIHFNQELQIATNQRFVALLVMCLLHTYDAYVSKTYEL